MATKTPSGAIVDEETGQLIQAPDSSVITGGDLDKTDPLNLPPTPTTPDYSSALASTSVEDLLAKINQPTATDTQTDEISKTLLNIQESIIGKGAKQKELEEKAGIPGLNTQLQDVVNQITSLKAEQAAIPIQIQEEFKGRGATTGGVQPIEAGRLRQNALRSLALSAQGQVLLGNLSNAQAQVNRSIDLEFGEAEARLKYLESAYNINKDKLERVDKKRSDALALLIQERSRIIESAKSDKQAGLLLANTAIQNFAGDQAAQIAAQKVLNLDAYDPQYLSKVYALVGKYQKDPVALKTAILQQEKLQLDVANAPLEKQKLLADIEYVKSQIAKNYKEAVGEQDLTELVAYAQQYASNGKIPTGMPKGTFGVISQLAKELPKQKGEIVDSKTGVKSDATSDTLQGAFGTLYSVIELAKELKDLDKERWGGVISGTLGGVTGDRTQKKYVDLRAQISDLLARARTGAAINATEEERYYKLLPGRFDEPFGIGADSQVRLDNFINTISSDLKNKTATQGLSIYGFSTVKVGGEDYKVGSIITYDGKPALVLPDGSLSIIE